MRYSPSWSGVAGLLIVAGVAFVAEGVVYLADGSPDTAGALQNVVALVATLALIAAVLGLPRVHEGRRQRAAVVGWVGTVVGLLVQVLALVVSLAGGPGVFRDTVFAVGFLVMALGLVVYGIAVLRTSLLPRWWAIAFFAPIPLLVAAGDYAVIVFGLLWLALGGSLLAQPRPQTA